MREYENPSYLRLSPLLPHQLSTNRLGNVELTQSERPVNSLHVTLLILNGRDRWPGIGQVFKP